MVLFSLFIVFDSQHCQSKCHGLYSDSRAKLDSCLETCRHDPIGNERVQFSQQIMRKDVVSCIGKCNEHVNSTTNFIVWSKCRKNCLINGNELHYFDDTQCVSHCDRFWKGTVHWKPCTSQCEGFKKSRHKLSRVSNKPPAGVYNVW